MIKVGSKAPLGLKVKDSKGKTVTLKDYLEPDQYLVLYFYPKDDTPGCTTQACGFRDAAAEIKKFAGRVVGVSKDDPASHVKFAKKHNLKFELLSDESTELNQKFGVWVEKNMFGNKYMGTQRSCFILDDQGKVIKIWEKASPKNNVTEVIKFLEQQ